MTDKQRRKAGLLSLQVALRRLNPKVLHHNGTCSSHGTVCAMGALILHITTHDRVLPTINHITDVIYGSPRVNIRTKYGIDFAADVVYANDAFKGTPHTRYNHMVAWVKEELTECK